MSHYNGGGPLNDDHVHPLGRSGVGSQHLSWIQSSTPTIYGTVYTLRPDSWRCGPTGDASAWFSPASYGKLDSSLDSILVEYLT